MAKKKKFYKKAKPKAEKKKLPSNYRKITEIIHSDHFVFLAGLICLLIAIIIVSINLIENIKLRSQYEAEKKNAAIGLVFWNNQIKEKPNYRDAYFSLALIYYQIKDFKNSSEYLQKAMEIDPNFKEGKELGEILKSY